MGKLKYGDFFLVVEDKNGYTSYLKENGEVSKNEKDLYCLGSLREAVEKCPSLPGVCIYRVTETKEDGTWKVCEIYEKDGIRRKTIPDM